MTCKNRVKESREAEAISRSEFARKAGIADRTLKRVEEGNSNHTTVTKNKILNVFNRLENKRRDYALAFLFPSE